MEQNRALPSLLAVLLLVSGSAAVYLGSQAAPAVDENNSDDEIPTPGPTTEPEPEPEPEPLCPAGQIQYLWSCITPVTNLAYTIPDDVRVGDSFWLTPTYDGDDARRWNASCADVLIDGRVHIFAEEPGTIECTVDGGNPVSVAWTNFSIVVRQQAPSNIDLGPGGFVLIKGQPWTLDAPDIEGGPVVAWSVAPPLPIGLSLNTETGGIIGTAYQLQAATVYTLTAVNSGGSTNASMTLAVVDQAPINVHWGNMDLVLTIDAPMIPQTAQHLGGAPVSYAADPPLPTGLEINATTGRMRGTPTVLQAQTTHFIWANNTGGGSLATLIVTVNDAPITSITYDRMPLDMVWENDTVDMMAATSGGTPVGWSIAPPLPAGLSFQAGRISGSAIALHPWTNHTITASNTGGEYSIILPIRVADITPTNLTWGQTDFILAANQSYTFPLSNDSASVESFTIHPAIDGLSVDANGTISGAVVGRSLNRHVWTQHTLYANNSGGSFALNISLAIHDLDADHAELSKRPVGAVNYGGSYPSLILPFGDWAFPVGMDSLNRPTVSASHAGEGRIVGSGHETMSSRSTGAHGNLSLNGLDWVCDGRQRVGLESSFNGWKDTLLAEGYSVTTSATPADLVNLDCFVTEFWNSYSDAENSQIEQWLTAGGGLIMGGHAWYWSYSNSDTAHNYPGNKIAKTTGLLVSSTNIYTTTTVPDEPWGPNHRLQGALPLLEAHYAGTLMLTGTDADEVANAINLCVSNLPIDFKTFWGAVHDLSNQTGLIHIDSQNTYAMNADEIDDLMLNVQEKLMRLLPADELFAHPSSSSFPGPVNASAPRPTRTIPIDGDFAGLPSGFGYANAGAHGRMSTGLYAAPGDVVTVTFPTSIVDTNVYVLIGGHTDNLWGKDTLLRHPIIYRNYFVDNTTMQVANAFGGAIYIQVPKGATLGMFNVTISGAVEMPWYQHGKTDVGDWRLLLRNTAAPTAELSSDWFILTVPSANIRTLDDPDYAMDFWDEALQMEHNLSGYTPWPRIERAQFDVQISAGWMHSGYPFMAHVASVDGVVNGTYMYQNGDWGMFHELGHNHQWMASTLPGNTEATCNLFSVRLMEDLVGNAGHGAMSPASREQRVESHFANGAPLSAWSVWTALETHILLKEAFGWAPITAALTEYYWNMSTQPSGDAEYTEWAIQTSLNTGYNLMPYFAAWNFPLTQASWDAVDHLPVWNTDPLRGWVHEYDLLTRDHAAANITGGTADLEWAVYDNGTNTSMTVCWGPTDGGNSTLAWANCAAKGTPSVGEFQHGVTTLTSGVNYKWRVVGENDNGQTWSDLQSFTAA